MIKTLDSSFWWPCWKISDWMPKRVCSVCENDKMYRIFFIKTSQNEPTDRSKAVCTTLPKNFPRRPKFLRSFLETIRTAKVFSTKLYFSSKVSCGHVGFSFDNPVGKLLTKYPKFLLNKRKGRKYTFFSEKNLIRMFLGSRRILCFTTEKLFARCLKTTERSFFFKQFSSNYIFRDVKCTFLELAEKRLPEDRIFSCQSPQKI